MEDDDLTFGDSDDFFEPMDAPMSSGFEIFERLGFVPLPPEAISDAHMRGRLWELIYALAARRFYMSSTNHLSDRGLYEWIYNDFMAEDHADMDPKHEWNTRISPVDTQLDPDAMIWLRYYADEADRQLWLKDGLIDGPMPPHEDPPYDRDRWLPDTPEIVQPFSISMPDDDDDDPLGLKDVDREIAAEREAREAEPEPPVSLPAWQKPGQVLVKSGVILLPPDELDEESVAPFLWELLHELACRGFYVLCSNHLTDAEMYRKLWRDSLREPAMLPGRSKTGGWFHDFVGSGSDADFDLWMRYHASDDTRAYYQSKQSEPLPPKEKPLFDRDWRTPKGPVA